MANNEELMPKQSLVIVINIDTNPFFMTRAGVDKTEQDDRIAINTSLPLSKAQYDGIIAAAGAIARYGMGRIF